MISVRKQSGFVNVLRREDGSAMKKDEDRIIQRQCVIRKKVTGGIEEEYTGNREKTVAHSCAVLLVIKI